MCRVSVIMGVYNIEHLEVFQQAVESVLGQTYQDFEFVICNDGSLDRTANVLESYAKKDARIRILQNCRRRGLAVSLNRCIAASRGKYLARQDADDLSLPRRLERQVVFLQRHPEISFVGTGTILSTMDRDWGRRILPSYPKAADFLFSNPYVHGSLMFRKSALIKAGNYRVAKETRRAEDYDLLMHMHAMGLYGANLQEPLYRLLEDAHAIRRRKYCYRIDEAKVRCLGFRQLGLLPKGLPYVVKPLFIGLIPARLLLRLKDGHTIQMQGTGRKGSPG